MVWPLTPVVKGGALIAKLGIPETDVVRFGFNIAVDTKWEYAIRAYVTSEGKDQIPFKNWFERPVYVQEVPISVDGNGTVVYGYVLGGTNLSTMDAFCQVRHVSDPDRVDGIGDLGTITVTVNKMTDRYSSATALHIVERGVSVPIRHLGLTDMGDYRAQSARYWNSAEAMAALGAAEMGSVVNLLDDVFYERRGCSAVVTHQIKLSDQRRRRFVLIQGPAVVTRGEVHPEYEWFVATTSEVAERMTMLRRYVTDTNELARLDNQVRLMRARGDDLIGVGKFSSNLNPYSLYSSTASHAKELYTSNDSSGSPSIVTINSAMRALAGSWFTFSVNLVDEKDDVELLIPGATALKVDVTDKLALTTTGGSVNVTLNDEVILLIVKLASDKGLPVTITTHATSDQALAQKVRDATAAVSTSALWNGSDLGFFGFAIISNCSGGKPSAAQDELIRTLVMPGVLPFGG